jgi:hypothetical protein
VYGQSYNKKSNKKTDNLNVIDGDLKVDASMKIEEMSQDSSNGDKSSTNNDQNSSSTIENTDDQDMDKLDKNEEIKANGSSANVNRLNNIDDENKADINDREKSRTLDDAPNINTKISDKNGKVVNSNRNNPSSNTDDGNKMNYKIVKEDSDDEDVLAPLSIILPFELTPSPDPSSYLSCLAYSLTTEEAFFNCCMDQCLMCGSAGAVECMLFCVDCGEAFHSFCADFPLSSMTPERRYVYILCIYVWTSI